MTTVKLPRGRLVHDTSPSDPTSTICGRPVAALVIVDGPVTCKRTICGRPVAALVIVDGPVTCKRCQR